MSQDTTVRHLDLSTLLRSMASTAGVLEGDLIRVTAERDDAQRLIAELQAVPPVACAPTASTRTLPEPLHVHKPTKMAELKELCTTTAQPGDLIDLGGLSFYDGGTLKVTRSGTPEHPIVFSNGEVLRKPGGPTAQIDGAWLTFANVAFRNGSKVVQVKGQHLSFVSCAFRDAGDELVKAYNGAVDVEFADCLWDGAGLAQPDIGEALYVGEHPGSTLARVSDIRVIGGLMRNFTAEGIDMKEGALGLSVTGLRIDCSQQVGVSFAGYAGIAIKGALAFASDVTIINPRVAGVVVLASANKPLWDVSAAVLLERITMTSADRRALHLIENRAGTPFLVQRDCAWQEA